MRNQQYSRRSISSIVENAIGIFALMLFAMLILIGLYFVYQATIVQGEYEHGEQKGAEIRH